MARDLDPIHLKPGDKIISRPASARCGGRETMVLQRPGVGEVSLGCPCHTKAVVVTGRSHAHWMACKLHEPLRSDYYLVTVAPRNFSEIGLDAAQAYARSFGRVAWYNESTGKWSQHRPGFGKSYEVTGLVTHWAPLPEGAEVDEQDLNALPKKGWEPSHFNVLDEIGQALVLGANSEAARIIREELLPMLEVSSTSPKT